MKDCEKVGSAKKDIGISWQHRPASGVGELECECLDLEACQLGGFPTSF